MSLRLLLDSHILLWWFMESAELSKRARSAIIEAESVFVSAASAWKLTIKAAVGKLTLLTRDARLKEYGVPVIVA